MASLTFHGAAREVTGSCHLLECEGVQVLLDCGLFQGPPDVERQNERPFPFAPQALAAVVLSHAHLDHSGLLPKLVREGFRGPIFVTAPTRDLLEILLADAAHLEARDAEWENRKRERAGRKPRPPLYTVADVAPTLARTVSKAYGERFAVAAGVEACFRDAGHILGSSIVELWVHTPKGVRHVVFSGDLGNRSTPMLRDPELIRGADVLLLESTYGDHDHRSMQETLAEFGQILDAAAASGGNVVIPSFAIGRAQEIMYRLGELFQAGRLRQQRVFLDSPMAIKATEVYEKYVQLFDTDSRHALRRNGGDAQGFLPVLQYTHTPEESMAINRIAGGAIIIAGSGMCSGGRVRHHLKWNLWRAAAHIVIVGFQAQGTPGRKLVDGARKLRLLGEDIAVKASVHTLGGFSAHAGQTALVDWAGKFRKPQPRVYLVHGEPEAMRTLKSRLKAVHGFEAQIPAPGQVIRL